MPDYYFPEVNTNGQFLDPKVIADIQAKAKSSIDAVIPPSGTEGHALVKTSTGTKWGSVESPYELRGTGFPEGKVTANPGTYYTDTAVTSGAWRWFKKSGTGNTGWVVVEGDTGWRRIYEGATVHEPSWKPGTMPSGGRLRIRRTADGLFVSADNITMATSNSPLTLLGGLPSQWHVAGDTATYPGAFYVLGGPQPVFRVDRGDLTGTHPGGMIRDIKFYPANTAWPTTLPGTPA